MTDHIDQVTCPICLAMFDALVGPGIELAECPCCGEWVEIALYGETTAIESDGGVTE